MKAVTERRDKQASGLVHHWGHWARRGRIEHNISQHHRLPCRMADKLDSGCLPHDAARAVSPDDVASRKPEWCLSVPAADDDTVCMLFHRFDNMAAPHVDAEFQRAFLEKRLGRGLRQEQHEWKT